MDDHLAALSERVASAADAWLSDPQDLQVYGRHVWAIREDAAYLNPTLDEHEYDHEAAAAPPADLALTRHSKPTKYSMDWADTSPVQLLGNALQGASPASYWTGCAAQKAG